jgi:hypothetical protein
VIGLAEPCCVPGHGAIANAVFNASGARIRDLPMTPDKVLARSGRSGRGLAMKAFRLANPTTIDQVVEILKANSQRGARTGRRSSRRPGPPDRDEGAPREPEVLVNLKGIGGLDAIQFDAQARSRSARSRRCEPRGARGRAREAPDARRSRAVDREPADPERRHGRRQPVPAPALLVLPNEHAKCLKKGGSECFSYSGPQQVQRDPRRGTFVHRAPLGPRSRRSSRSRRGRRCADPRRARGAARALLHAADGRQRAARERARRRRDPRARRRAGRARRLARDVPQVQGARILRLRARVGRGERSPSRRQGLAGAARLGGVAPIPGAPGRGGALVGQALDARRASSRARPPCAAPSRSRRTPTRSRSRRGSSLRALQSLARAVEIMDEPDSRNRGRSRRARSASHLRSKKSYFLAPPRLEECGPPGRQRALLVPQDDARPGTGRGARRAVGLPAGRACFESIL